MVLAKLLWSKNITGILKNNGSIYFNNRSSNLSELNRKTVARKNWRSTSDEST